MVRIETHPDMPYNSVTPDQSIYPASAVRVSNAGGFFSLILDGILILHMNLLL